MWQDIAIVFIVISIIVFVGYRVTVIIKKPDTTCNNCAGCPLKEQIKEKNLNCKDVEKKSSITVQKENI